MTRVLSSLTFRFNKLTIFRVGESKGYHTPTSRTYRVNYATLRNFGDTILYRDAKHTKQVRICKSKISFAFGKLFTSSLIIKLQIRSKFQSGKRDGRILKSKLVESIAITFDPWLFFWDMYGRVFYLLFFDGRKDLHVGKKIHRDFFHLVVVQECSPFLPLTFSHIRGIPTRIKIQNRENALRSSLAAGVSLDNGYQI